MNGRERERERGLEVGIRKRKCSGVRKAMKELNSSKLREGPT